MKYLTLSLFLACVCMANAQQPPPPPDGPMGSDPRPPGGDKIGRAFFPPELVMRNQKAINLTPDQQGVIREEMRQAMPRFTELQWQLSAEEELMLVESELKRVRFALLVKLKALLTPLQQQKLEELKKRQRPDDAERRPPPRDGEP